MLGHLNWCLVGQKLLRIDDQKGGYKSMKDRKPTTVGAKYGWAMQMESRDIREKKISKN